MCQIHFSTTTTSMSKKALYEGIKIVDIFLKMRFILLLMLGRIFKNPIFAMEHIFKEIS